MSMAEIDREIAAVRRRRRPGLRVVLDTDVLVAGLLAPRRESPGEIVDLFLAGEIDALVDDRILAEYRAVLPRREVRVGTAEISSLLDAIEIGRPFEMLGPSLGVELPDPADVPFSEGVARHGQADSLVHGKRPSFQPAEQRIRVESPAGFIGRWKTDKG